MVRRITRIGIVIALGVIAGAVLFLAVRPLEPQTETPLQVLATVNGVAINREMVETEITISRFNVNNPLPPLTGDDLRLARDEALNQLITRQLVLQAASRQNFVLEDKLIENQVNLLFGASGEQALAEALDQVGATRSDLTWWVRELTTVESFSINVIMAGAAPEARQQVYNDWLNSQRAAAAVKTHINGQTQRPLALVGEPAPDFTLTNLSGQPVSLANYRGKIVLVNFWTTWCPSCISEMPAYEQIYQQYGGPAGEFVVLSINLQESQAQVEAYANGLGLTFPVLLDHDGGVTTRHYQVTGMPGSFLIDQEGVIVYRHVGPLSGENLQAKLTQLGF